jgi:uncharacterized protein
VKVVDTNVLVYAAVSDSPHHATCRAWLESQCQRADAWYTTWPVIYEFLRVATHPRVLRNPLTLGQAWSFIAALTGAPGFAVLLPTARHTQVLESVLAESAHLAGNVVHDLHTVVLMREHGIRQVVTRDADFHRFAGIEVFDPCVALERR